MATAKWARVIVLAIGVVAFGDGNQSGGVVAFGDGNQSGGNQSRNDSYGPNLEANGSSLENASKLENRRPDATPRRYVTEKDRELAKWANQAVEAYCDGGFRGEVVGTQTDMATGMGSDNLLISLLKKYGDRQRSGDDLVDLISMLQEEAVALVMQPWICVRVAPLVFAVLAGLLWLCCCWSACPCCWRCRCRARERKSRLETKFCLVVVVCTCFLVSGMCGYTTHTVYNRIQNGFNNMLCSGAQLLNTTLMGESAEYGFVGVVPALDSFYALENELSPSSPLMLDLDDILANTSDIEDAFRVTSESLKLLGSMLAEPTNVRPNIWGPNTSTYHICSGCEFLSPLVAEMSKEVEEGFSSALSQARSAVRRGLSGTNRVGLQQAFREASGPILQLKDQISTPLEMVVDPEANLAEVKVRVESFGYYGILSIHAVALLLICCGCCSTCCFIMCPYKGEDDYRDPARSPRRCSCLVWCCSFLFLFLVFLVLGILNIIFIPASGLCLVLADLNGDLLEDIAAGIGLNLTGDEGLIFQDMVDTCWAGTRNSSNLLDVMYVREGLDGNETGEAREIFLRERIVSMVREPVEAAFAAIEGTVANATSVGSSSAFEGLKSALHNAPIRAAMVPEPPYLSDTPWFPGPPWLLNNSNYSGLVGDPFLMIAVNTSMDCYALDMPGLGEFYSMHDFSRQLITRYGKKGRSSEPVLHGCLQRLNWQAGGQNRLAPEQQQACMAANRFLDLKRYLLEAKVFRCDMFRPPKNGTGNNFTQQVETYCDPLNMKLTQDGSWIGDCLRYNDDGDAVMDQVERYCDLFEFENYVRLFANRLTIAVERLDNATMEAKEAIGTDLRSITERYVLGHIAKVTNGADCGFMPGLSKQVVDGMCYQGLDGLRIAANMCQATALFVALLAADMYFLWRINIDNATKRRQREYRLALHSKS